MTRAVSVREARATIAELLDAVEAGEEIVITRRGRAVARLAAAQPETPETVRFPSRLELRERMPVAVTPAGGLMRSLRDERG